MLVVFPLQPAAAAYYFRGQGPGWWAGRGAASLGLAGRADLPDLRSVLAGRDPATGRFLPEVRRARRRAGWDLVLAAPKSLSLLAALAPGAGPALRDAHRRAVADVLDHLETRLLPPAPGPERATRPATRPVDELRAVLAFFEHRRNAAGEPHLHTHVLLANLGQGPDGRWRAVGGRWWPNRQALGALYQLGVRHHLAAAGWGLAWQPRPDGLADLAGVPRAAVEAASSRQRDAAAERERFDPLLREGARGARRGAGPRTRRAAGTAPWEARARAAGFGTAEAAALLAAARPAGLVPPPGAPPDSEAAAGAVGAWLAARRSTFRAADVLTGLAATQPRGLPAAAAVAWVDRFTARAVRVAPGRWTTEASRRADDRLLAAGSRVRRGRAVVSPATLDEALAGHPGLPDPAAVCADHLVRDGRAVEILAAPPGRSGLVGHATVLDAARTAWQLGGYRVALDTPSTGGAARWRALTALRPARPGEAVDVLVVDQADRRPTGELRALVEQADRDAVKLVLVEGGTRGRLTWTRSAGLDRLGEHLGRLSPGALPAWGQAPAAPATSGAVLVSPSHLGAARHLLAEWHRARQADPRARLVGLGPPEVDALNRAARHLLARRGTLHGPAVCAGEREMQAGDEVVALRRTPLGRPGAPSPGVPAGTVGTVAAVDTRRGQIHVCWPQGAAVLDRRAAAALGHGYAIPPSLAARVDGPLLVLGDPAVLRAQRHRVQRAALVTPAEPRRWRRPAPQRDPAAGREVAAGRERNHDLGLGLG